MKHVLRVLIAAATLALATVAGARAGELSTGVACGAEARVEGPAAASACGR
jgi:hypothetical protein